MNERSAISTFTITGNITADPDLQTTASGVPVVNLTVAQNERVYDQEAGQWRDRDGGTLFLRCHIWREQALNTVESLAGGDRVVVLGKLRPRSFDDRGMQRTVIELDVDELGVSLRYGTFRRVFANSEGTSEENRSVEVPV